MRGVRGSKRGPKRGLIGSYRGGSRGVFSAKRAWKRGERRVHKVHCKELCGVLRKKVCRGSWEGVTCRPKPLERPHSATEGSNAARASTDT